jgi:hypothetical protein
LVSVTSSNPGISPVLLTTESNTHQNISNNNNVINHPASTTSVTDNKKNVPRNEKVMFSSFVEEMAKPQAPSHLMFDYSSTTCSSSSSCSVSNATVQGSSFLVTSFAQLHRETETKPTAAATAGSSPSAAALLSHPFQEHHQFLELPPLYLDHPWHQHQQQQLQQHQHQQQQQQQQHHHLFQSQQEGVVSSFSAAAWDVHVNTPLWPEAVDDCFATGIFSFDSPSQAVSSSWVVQSTPLMGSCAASSDAVPQSSSSTIYTQFSPLTCSTNFN